MKVYIIHLFAVVETLFRKLSLAPTPELFDLGLLISKQMFILWSRKWTIQLVKAH